MATQTWLDEREQRAWRGFLAVHAQLGGRLRRSLQQDSGLSDADYAVLVNLSEAPEGRLRIFELVTSLNWEKSRLSHQLRRMEDRGLLEREGCPTDRRGAFVVVTEAGLGAVRSAAPQHAADVRRWFVDALTPDQLDVLAEITDSVLVHLGQGDRRCPE